MLTLVVQYNLFYSKVIFPASPTSGSAKICRTYCFFRLFIFILIGTSKDTPTSKKISSVFISFIDPFNSPKA